MTVAVDLFAGWGGFSLGAEQAGCSVAWAGNHWPLAVTAHQLNHPTARHVCQDLRQADWTALPNYQLLLASPACQGHSQASQPRRRAYHDALRATAWAVVDCADVTEPETILVENVPDFLRWRLYPAWRAALEALGYRIEELKLRASHFGVPQRRDRIFVVASRRCSSDGLLDLVRQRGQEETPFGPCIDWDADVRWTPIAKATDRVRDRIARGRKKYGRRFLSQHVRNHPGVSLDEPIRTITTGDQWVLVDGAKYRPLTVRENARAMGFPDDYSWPEGVTRRDAIRGLGNAVCPPVARRLIQEVTT